MVFRQLQRTFLLLPILALPFAESSAQGFYDLSTIQTIEIFFAGNNWDQLLDAEKAGDDGYILADSVRINGEMFDSVGVKYKGNSSYDPDYAKNPLTIALDYEHGNADYQGYKDITLGNCFADHSMLREAFSYQLLRRYMDAPECNFARVYINGNLHGLYSNVESITKTFIKKYNYPDGNAFIKCNPDENGPNATSNLAYLGPDSADYKDFYGLRSDYGWRDLIDLCDTLANHTGAVERILDVDKALWMLAFNNGLVNLDSYTGAFAQNYFLFRDANDRFAPVVWDLNMSLGGYPLLGAAQVLDLQGMRQFNPVYGEGVGNRPLLDRLLANSTYRKMYVAHLRTIIAENFSNNNYVGEVQSLMDLIDADVLLDPNKFYSYDKFLNNLDESGSDIGFFITPGIRELMQNRTQWLTAHPEMQKTPPAISSVVAQPAQPVLGGTATIRATVSGAGSVRLGWRSQHTDKFAYQTMYDDGQHNDGAAGDNVYGANISVQNLETEYYIWAEDADAGVFSPQRAEHEFYILNATSGPLQPGQVVINEFLASNQTINQDPAGEFEDWIELFNTTSVPLDLSGAHLSDDLANPDKWAFPEGVVIAPNGYLLVWCDENGSQAGLHANFKLAASGEKLALYAPGGNTLLDEIDFPAQLDDISMARCPNGTGSFTFTSPTPLAPNCSSATLTPADIPDVSITPNPASDHFALTFVGVPDIQLEVCDLNGKVLLRRRVQSGEAVSVAPLAAGVYVIKLQGMAAKKLVKF